MPEQTEAPKTQFEKRQQPDLRQVYSAEKIEKVPYATVWEGEITDNQCEFQVIPDVFETAPEIKQVRQQLIEFQTYGKTYRNDPKARLSEFSINQNGAPILTFQKVKYADYIVTNNSMEIVPTGSTQTIREILEPGPRLKTLSESKCSNHLGLNCLVLTADNKIILQRAGMQKITGGGQTTSSASGAMDFKESFVNPFECMQAELFEEIGLTQEETAEIKAIAIGRELARGGKPEMFFILRTNLIAQEILDRQPNDPDREVASRFEVEVTEEKARELIEDQNTSQSTKAALHYLSRYLQRQVT